MKMQVIQSKEDINFFVTKERFLSKKKSRNNRDFLGKEVI
jgi:hypothetical protein